MVEAGLPLREHLGAQSKAIEKPLFDYRPCQGSSGDQE
jgi:hypothetical protein